jgi:hypothetical protein
MSEQDRTVYVDVREGPAPATVPGDVVSALVRAANDDQAAARGIETAALVIVRLGREAGEAMLRHLVEHDPALLLGADPLFADTLANEPELIVGPLAGTAPCTPVR